MTGTITGWGHALPDRVLANDELQSRHDLPPGWIEERTGIATRRVGCSTAALATAAGRDALARAGVGPDELDLLVLATCTPDAAVPATATLVQRELGATGLSFDLNVACSGFVVALLHAFGALATGSATRALVLGAETMHRLVDPTDRNTSILFGDGAGAVVVEASAGASALRGADLGTDPSTSHLLTCALGGTLSMDGREVFRQAVRTTVASCRRALDRAGWTTADVDLVVPHQANVRILEAVAARLGVPLERMALVVRDTGNTSAASIPLALATAADEGRLAEGSRVLLTGFGAGMTWASACIRWTGGTP